ncbi:unnamed protein product, partial [Rotaria magnacalcarata]
MANFPFPFLDEGHRQKSQIKLNTVTLGSAHRHDSL